MGRKKTSIIWSVSKEVLEDLVKNSDTMTGVLAYFGFQNKGGNNKTLKKRLNEEGIDFSKYSKNYGVGRIGPLIPLEKILVENSSYNRSHLKKRLIKNDMIEEKCSKCGLQDKWCGESLVLILDHVNGICNDNRIDNLRLLCPNCNSQTSTFAGRNINHKKNKCFCGKIIGKKSKLCRKCEAKNRRRVVRPLEDKLKREIETDTWVNLGKKYGVSGNTVRKWAVDYGLIRRK